MGRERRRLAPALLLSLLIHALLLSLTFGSEELGLPGFAFPWRDRRIEVPALRVVLAAPRVTAARSAVTPVAEPVQQASITPHAEGPTPAPSMSPAPPPRLKADVIVPKAEPTAEAMQQQTVATVAPEVKAPLRPDGPGDAAPAPTTRPPVIALEQSDEAAPVVPPAASAPTPVVAVAPSASSPEPSKAARVEAAPVEAEGQEAAQREAARKEAMRVEAAREEAERQEAARQAAMRSEVAQQEAARKEAMRIEAAREEAERQEAARQAAMRNEAAQQEAARKEATRIEAAREEAERQEAARVESLRLEAERHEAERQEAARQEAARQAAAQRERALREAARQEAARLEAERQEAARQAAARQEAMRAQAAQEETERREAARRAMGRQLDEEAARREAASTPTRPPGTLPYSWSSARRGRLFGRTDPNAELVLYAEAWARKIQLNTTNDTVREAAKRPHTDPLVTVAIRSDGSVESVTFVLSSGVAEIDEGIRRIIQSQLPYQPFPPGLAREYDVIEIRRTWYFDAAVRLY
jgi:hypothetical protein